MAGGKRSPSKKSLKPILTERVFDIVCMDSFRMPIAYREKKEVEKFDYKDVLSGGANRGYLYQWCFLVIDVHSKVVFLEISQFRKSKSLSILEQAGTDKF